MGDEYYDKDGYVYTKSGGAYEPKWDFWAQSQARESHDMDNQPSGYASNGTPVYKGRDSGSGGSTSSEGEADGGLALLAALLLLAMLIVVVVVIFVVVAPAVAVVRKGIRTQHGKQQLRNFGLTVLVTSTMLVLSVATISSLGGNYSNDWGRLFQFLITVVGWGAMIHLAVKRKLWRTALESTRYFSREYIYELAALVKHGQETLETRFS